MKGILGRMLYANDLVVVAESKQKIQEALREFKEAFRKYGLKMCMEKMEVIWVGQQKK